MPIIKKDENELNQKNEKEDPKIKFKAAIMKLFTQLKTGCKKDICNNQYCIKNPFCK